MKPIQEKAHSENTPKELSLLGLVRVLFAGATQMYPQRGLQRAKDRAKFCLRGLAMPLLTRQWFQLLANPTLSVVVRNSPRVLSKLQRPYLHRKLKARERLNVLKEHYRFVQEMLLPGAMEQIYSERGAVLAKISVEGTGEFSLRLGYWSPFEKEGELSIALMDEASGGSLFVLSFSVTSFSPAESDIFIGGLQTMRKTTNRELVVDITRGMSGLRPKALLLYALQQLASAWHFKHIRAVSNDLLVFRDFRLKKKLVAADYDEFWIESDGRLDADGFFTLPIEFVPRPITEIKPNKRSLYKKRYSMLDGLGSQIALHASQMILAVTLI
jgi:uncharacterized protein VirK/YbjX